MLFNSIEFLIFLPAVFFVYWFALGKSLRLQNFFLFIASYLFYGWWDWRFLLLIFISSSVDYFIGVCFSHVNDNAKRKILLFLSVSVNISLLGFFKYYNFFIESFVSCFSLISIKISDPYFLNIILPVGISFYTFQTLSYSIDVYKKKIVPTNDIISFFAFVSFFPQLVAGPIERASNLLPQFKKYRNFNYVSAVDGLRQILWGLFKKIVIADNCATYVNDIFSNYTQYSGSTLFLGVFFFSFQIYGDFSGYSDIAIGTSRLFGFNLERNFAYPYFSRDIAEFWRRWHISLSSWFRDYVYIPIGGSKGRIHLKIRNVLIIFVISGFWHGANWTFIVWGLLNALYFIPLMVLNKNRNNTDIVSSGRLFPSFHELFQIIITFIMTSVAWVFFRSNSVSSALNYLKIIFSASLINIPEVLPVGLLILLFIFLVIEWLQRNKQHALELDSVRIPVYLRWSLYYFLIVLIWIFGGEQKEFIYFQF